MATTLLQRFGSAYKLSCTVAFVTAVVAHHNIAHADTPPRLISAPEIEAPTDLPIPTEGVSVSLVLTVDTSGAVVASQVDHGVRTDVDNMVANAALRMRFIPAEQNGRPVSVRIRFVFRLRPPTRPLRIPVYPFPEQDPNATTQNPANNPGANRSGAEQGVTVRGVRPEPGAATRLTFRAEELVSVPGTFGEPTRIVASQPGVGRTPFGLGYFVVRGASFENTGFFIDGFPVLILYHLAAGPAVISSRLIGQLDFYPGGYPLQYGRFSAGVISLSTRPPPTDRPRAELEVDQFRASLLGVLPFDQGRGTVAFSLRRSYYDFLLPLFLPGVAINYTDGQIRADYRFSDRLRVSFFLFGSSDNFDRTEAVGSGQSAASSRDGLLYNFVRAITSLEWRGPHGLEGQVSTMLGWDETRIIQADPGRPDRGLSAGGTVTGLRASLRIPTQPLTTTIGLDALGYAYDVRFAFASPSGLATVPPPQANPRVANISAGVTQLNVGGWIESVLRVNPVEITAGSRVEMFRYAGNTHVVADPRAVVRVKVHPNVRVIGSTGLFHQPPPFFGLTPQAGNPNLLPQYSWQSSLGVEADLPLNIDVRLTGYFNRMWQLPRATFQIVMTPQGPQRALALSDGEGRSFGLEVLVRRQIERGLYGWLSYTFSRSERFIGDGRVVPFTFDQTHILNLAVSYEPEGWPLRFGARFQLATGAPTSRVYGAIYDADADGFRPQYDSESDRLPIYHQLDIRVDYRFRLGPLRMSAFIDILNVYYAQNSEGWVYQYDYMDRRPRPGLPILPAAGLRGEL